MPVDIQDKIANLRLHILSQEREVSLLEQKCDDLKAELAEFEARFNVLIKPLSDQIDAVKSALDTLRDLQLKQQMGDAISVASFLRGDSVEEDPYIPPHERDFAIPEAIERPQKRENKSIKSLYRQLARQYHPDLAQDEADRERRTKIMSLINTAYQNEDFESLRALDNANPEQKTEAFNSQIPLDMMIFRQLQAQSHDLAVEIRDLKDTLHELRFGHMMELKLEASIAKSKGKDFLAELADDMQAEYWRYVQELDILRQEVN
ncbi:MAG: hypothetical protein Phog2KO_31900 [Phototrophicaceae bacterium]